METRHFTPLPADAGATTVATDEALPLPQQILAFAEAHRYWLFAGILLLYLIGFNGQWRVERDSALYLTLGRNLAEGQGYTYLGQPHHLAMPGLPLVLAGTFRLFKTESVVPALCLMFLMGLATLGLTYRLFLLHAGRPYAVLMTAGLAATRLFYRYCFEILSDLPFLLGVMAFLTGYEAVFFRRDRGKRRAGVLDWVLLVGGMVLAVAMRPNMWVLVLVAATASGWAAIRGDRRHILPVALVVVAAALFLLFDLRKTRGPNLPDYENDVLIETYKNLGTVLHRTVTQNLPQLCEATLAKALFGCPIGPGLNTVAAIVVFGLGLWLLRYRLLWGLWVLATLATLLIFPPVDRYLLAVLPLLVFAWWHLLVWLHHRLPAKWADIVFLGLLIGGISTNLARMSEMIVDQRRTPFIRHYHDGRYVSIYPIGKLLRQNTPPDAWILVGTNAARVIGYVGHRYAMIPRTETTIGPPGAPVFALIGPTWDDRRSKDLNLEDDMVKSWMEAQGFALGEKVGPPIRNHPEKVAWQLYRIIKP